MKVIVTNKTKFRPSKERMSLISKKVLKKLYPDCKELSIIYVSGQEMKSINKKFRGKNSVTDGLAFEYPEEKSGEIVICPEYIVKEADELGMSHKELYEVVLVHALSHIAGYDHKTKEQANEMEAVERSMHKLIGKI